MTRIAVGLVSIYIDTCSVSACVHVGLTLSSCMNSDYVSCPTLQVISVALVQLKEC